MFFVLSKVLYFIIQPINWVVALLFFAVFSKKPNRKKACAKWALILSLFFNHHFTFNLVMRAWEPETITKNEIKETYDVGILLGGYSNFYITPDDDRHNFSSRANRFNQTLRLYHEGYIKKILLTGGSGAVLHTNPSEAEKIKTYLMSINIPETDIIVEADSRNTHENALFTKQILDEQYPNQKYLLITSAWHMRRSAACFKKQDVPFTPYAVDYLSERVRFAPISILIPDRLGFAKWEMLIKEWVGYIVYKLRNYA